MTDEQIIKALECCATDDGDDCFQCPYGNIVYKPGNGGCVNRCRKDALNLINRQKARTKELEERIYYLEESIDCSRKEHNRSLQKMQQLKSEAIKEFAEQLKETAYSYSDISGYRSTVVDADSIDNLIKEMTEEMK